MNVSIVKYKIIIIIIIIILSNRKLKEITIKILETNLEFNYI